MSQNPRAVASPMPTVTRSVTRTAHSVTPPVTRPLRRVAYQRCWKNEVA
jgi:hypothetical protein